MDDNEVLCSWPFVVGAFDVKHVKTDVFKLSFLHWIKANKIKIVGIIGQENFHSFVHAYSRVLIERRGDEFHRIYHFKSIIADHNLQTMCKWIMQLIKQYEYHLVNDSKWEFAS